METARAPPQSVTEWADYFDGLCDEELLPKAKAVNSVRFVRLLMDEGLCAAEVHQVMCALARTVQASGAPFPEGFYALEELGF